MQVLLDRLSSGDTGALARLITLAEEQGAEGRAAVSALYARAGKAMSVGLTGPPGAGKSTLINRLVVRYGRRHTRTAVLAVDPSSPLTSGALLGDRVRLSADAGHEVFFRSMASRGSDGGLSAATGDALVLLDAAGYEVILVETVGAGQSDLAVAQCADLVVLVVTPNSGDLIQAMKAGVAELADIFVVNKSDILGADQTRRDIKLSLHWRSRHRLGREPVVLTASAANDEGIDELTAAIDETHAHLRSSGLLAERHRARVRHQLVDRLRTALWERSQADPALASVIQEQVERVVRLESDPYSAAEIVLAWLFGKGGASTGQGAGAETVSGRKGRWRTA